MDADEVGQLDLPAHTHAAILSRRDLRTRRLTVVPVVWADYAFDRCPHCHEELDVVPDCPVTINSAGGVEQVDRMHGCGFWLFTEYLVLPEASETRFLEWGAQVAERRRKKVDADRLD